MSGDITREVAAHWARADESLRAATAVLDDGFLDFAASRAYYAAFYAASGLLLQSGHEFRKHSAVIAAINTHFVATGKVKPTIGRSLRWLFELRGVGDYGVVLHVSEPDAVRAVAEARVIIEKLKKIATVTT